MKIYLVRHAEAVERAEGLEDSIRWLTARGRKIMQKTVSRLRKMRVKPELIITSPLTRTVQTAELILPGTGKRTGLVASSLLAPESSPEQVVALIRSHTGQDGLMLVGHEPL